jgi:hypothetical protein
VALLLCHVSCWFSRGCSPVRRRAHARPSLVISCPCITRWVVGWSSSVLTLILATCLPNDLFVFRAIRGRCTRMAASLTARWTVMIRSSSHWVLVKSLRCVTGSKPMICTACSPHVLICLCAGLGSRLDEYVCWVRSDLPRSVVGSTA